jgi:hypothetical protein
MGIRGPFRFYFNPAPFRDLNGIPGGAIGNAGAAARALLLIHKTGPFLQGHLKISRSPFHALYITERDDLDILVSADLNKPGGLRAHGTIVCGKCLVELRHHAADGRLVIGKIHLDAALRQVKGSLHAADSTADDQC